MNGRKLLQQTLCLTAVVLLLAGCGGTQAIPTTTPVPLTGTPIPPTATPVPPTAKPVPPTATPVPPTPKPTTGQVKGVLVEDTEQPAAGQTLRLPTVEESGGELTFHFEDDSPITETNSSGTFLFEEVPPGRYALAAFLPLPTFLESDTGATIVFEVVAGEVVDLGTIPIKTQ